MDTLKYLEDLEQRAELGGGRDRLAKQHAAGKLTARERIDLLFDPGTFQEMDKLVTHRCRDFGMEEQIIPGDGVVCGQGRVDGRPVFAYGFGDGKATVGVRAYLFSADAADYVRREGPAWQAWLQGLSVPA